MESLDHVCLRVLSHDCSKGKSARGMPQRVEPPPHPLCLNNVDLLSIAPAPPPQPRLSHSTLYLDPAGHNHIPYTNAWPICPNIWYAGEVRTIHHLHFMHRERNPGGDIRRVKEGVEEKWGENQVQGGVFRALEMCLAAAASDVPTESPPAPAQEL